MAAVDSSLYEKFIIESVDGSKTANIAEGVVSFNYNEDLYSPMLTAKVLVINTGNTIQGKDGKFESLYNGFPLRGGERVVIKVSGNCATNKGLDFSDKPSKYFYVGSITNVLIKDGKETFTLN